MTPSEVRLHVATYFRVDIADVLNSGIRTRTAVRARKAIVYWLKTDRGCSWGEIARALNARKRTVRSLYSSAMRDPDEEIAMIMGGKA